MHADIGERIFERRDRAEIAGIALYEERMKGTFHVRRQLERIILDRLDARQREAELGLDLGARLKHFHDTLHDHTKRLSQLVHGFRRHVAVCKACAPKQLHEIQTRYWRRRWRGPLTRS